MADFECQHQRDTGESASGSDNGASHVAPLGVVIVLDGDNVLEILNIVVDVRTYEFGFPFDHGSRDIALTVERITNVLGDDRHVILVVIGRLDVEFIADSHQDLLDLLIKHLVDGSAF